MPPRGRDRAGRREEIEPASSLSAELAAGRSSGNFCRNSKRQAGFLHASREKYEIERIPVDAFRQKAYRPAHNSTIQIFNTTT
jgi:hypothetical protein